MVTMDAFASAFGFDAKSDDVWTTLGKVTAVGSGTLSVLLGGSATPTECEAYCLAGVGDIVFVAITKGRARAIACKGGGSTGEYLPITGGTLTGDLTVETDLDVDGDVSFGGGATIAEQSTWRSALGLGTIATAGSADYLKRQPSGTSDLPQDTATGSGYPIVLSDSFANNGVLSYMTAANFRALLGVSAKPTQLYNNATGSNGTITLSQTAANFNHMRIYYKHSDDNTYSSVDVYSPNSKLVLLTIIEATSSAAWIVGRLVQISGTSVSTYNNWYGVQNTTTGASYSHTNYVSIVRVEGWND